MKTSTAYRILNKIEELNETLHLNHKREIDPSVKERLDEMGETMEQLIEQMHGIIFEIEE